MIHSLKRGWYINQIVSYGITYFLGKEIHQMTDRELKTTLTLLRATRKGDLNGYGIT